MARFEESNELFGKEIGGSTCGYVQCEICMTNYNKDNEDKNGEIIDPSIPGILHTDFAGLCVCDCCFEKIEREILIRMPDILSWFSRILDAREKSTEALRELLNDIKKKL